MKKKKQGTEKRKKVEKTSGGGGNFDEATDELRRWRQWGRNSMAEAEVVGAKIGGRGESIVEIDKRKKLELGF